MEYLKTHPWLTFKLHLPSDQMRLWLRLGEATSKVEHLAGAPLRPDIAQELHKIYLAKGVLATTAIEGNTLTEQQVQLQIDGKLELPKSQQYLQQEVQNILDVCNRESSQLLSKSKGIGEHPGLCVDLIKSYNRDVLKGLELSDGTVPGEIRGHSVVVGNVYRGAPAADCEFLLEKLCEWLNGPDFQAPDDELKISFALVKSVVAHVYLAWIHPFGDGNGRTARLVEFHILFASGIPLPAAHLLSDHYNLTRTAYYRQLAQASASKGDLIPFISYAIEGFLDGLRIQINTVRNQQMRVAWENYVFAKFSQIKSSPTQKRRRDLVLELTRLPREWVPVSKIPLLTPQLATEYATAGTRMIQRDLNALARMDLITRSYGQVIVRDDRMQGFLPGRVLEPAKRNKLDS